MKEQSDLVQLCLKEPVFDRKFWINLVWENEKNLQNKTVFGALKILKTVIPTFQNVYKFSEVFTGIIRTSYLSFSMRQMDFSRPDCSINTFCFMDSNVLETLDKTFVNKGSLSYFIFINFYRHLGFSTSVMM